MKIKKGLALILALVMIITLMPTMAFAATTNSVIKTYTVATDSPMPVVAIDLRVNDSTGIRENATTKFRINLENAEWAVADPSADNLLNQTDEALKNAFDSSATFETAGLAVGTIKNGATDVNMLVNSTTPTEDQIDVTDNVDDNFAEITIKNIAISKDDYIRIYLSLKAGSEDGAVQVSIDGDNSPLTSGTYTVATASSSTTTANVTGKVETYPRQPVTGANVEIRETSVTAIDTDQILRLTLPRGYEWDDLSATGDLVKDFAALGGNKTTLSGLLEAATEDTANSGDYCIVDGRTLYVYVGIDANAGLRQSIILTPEFDITRDAEMGDVTLSISSYRAMDNGDRIASASDLVIAVYGDDTVSVTTLDEEDLPEVVAGYEQDNDDNNFVVQVTFKESTPGSLLTGRYIDFDLNDEIQVTENQPIKAYIGTRSRGYYDSDVEVANADIEPSITDDRSEFTLRISDITGYDGDWDTKEANTVTVFIPVTAEANYTGDIELTVSGARAGVEETTLTVGTVIAPITVETEVTNIVNGAQKQETADITITENIAGYLDDGAVTVDLDTLNLDGFSFDTAKAEVTDGDLSIDKIKIGKDEENNNVEGMITIPIKDLSTEVSTITISGVVVNLGRNLPEGEYLIGVGGTALVENPDYMDGDFADDTVTTPYLNITTAADTEKGVNATFTDGQASYTLDGETVEMDVAPYIDSNNRMLVPIRYAANAMGVSDDNIQWNSYTQTGTISGAMGVVRVTVGSTNLITSNGTITMDTVAVNTNNRIYVPVRYIANALGASVSWDPATRTATFTS